MQYVTYNRHELRDLEQYILTHQACVACQTSVLDQKHQNCNTLIGALRGSQNNITIKKNIVLFKFKKNI